MSYTLAIVDDEKIVRESLASIIDWDTLGLSLVFTARNGKDALQQMEQVVPDILLTDIKMPHMDGIELALHVRTHYPSCHVIFLSGHTDKAYLKSAISLKVESYIEKPVDVEELRRTLFSLVGRLQNDQPPPGTQPLLLSNFAVTSYLVKQEIAVELITMQAGGYQTVYSRFFPLYFTWGKSSSFRVICLHISPKKGSEELSPASVTDVLYATLYAVPVEERLDFFLGQITGRDYALIVHQPEKEQLLASLKKIQKRVQEKYEMTLAAGISTKATDATRLDGPWKEAREFCSRRFYLGNDAFIDSDTSHGRFTTTFTEGLFSPLPATFDDTRQLFQVLNQEWTVDIQKLKEKLYGLYKAMMDRTVNTNIMALHEFNELTLHEIEELVLYGMHVLLTALGNDQYDPKIKHAAHYILWNYANPNLSIQMIAEAVGITPNYLSSLFRRYTGITINSFLIDVRIEKTKKLLRTTDLRLYEIADKVGIPDANYLSIVFKKQCGQTPSQYRDSVLKGKSS